MSEIPEQDRQGLGVAASPPGHSAEPEPICVVSAADAASVPNAEDLESRPAAMLERLNELIGENPRAVAQFLLCQDSMRNPATVVRGRAGFLLCREYMARFVEQGGDSATAASIRANWIPAWGDDPGPPRRYDFDEICESGEDGGPPWKAKPVGPNLEARCEAAIIMFALGMTPPGEEGAA